VPLPGVMLCLRVYLFVVGFLIEHVIDRARPVGLVHDAVVRASQGGPGSLWPRGYFDGTGLYYLAVAVLALACGW